MPAPDALRSLPPVQAVLEALAGRVLRAPHALRVREIRAACEDARRQILAGADGPGFEHLVERVALRLQGLETPSFRNVINATGVVLHTNLGRAPLGAYASLPGYSNLEYDLQAGARGRRDAHVGGLFEALLGCPALVVNNGAAAAFLALSEMAAGGEVIVSRGELIEIGDGFRIPEILRRSGAVLREVGTTNRTTIDDYAAAVSPATRLILRVHPSNFRMSGFTSKPTLSALVALGREREIPVYEDLGSGNVADLRAFGIDEPLVADSLSAGVTVISFSGDKLLGGPQAGILAGSADWIARLRRNPLFRALRASKLVYQALETTLRHLLFEEWDAIPALAMIRQSAEAVEQRSRRLFPDAEIIPGESVIGGGATPDQSIPTALVVAATRNANSFEKALRGNEPPVIARISEERVLLDLRTVLPDEEGALRRAVLSYARS